jgi:hypothetical protein
MKNTITCLLCLSFVYFLSGCSRQKLEEKGFKVSFTRDEYETVPAGLKRDSLQFETRPGNVLLTGISNVRLTPVYKINFNKDSVRFTGSNNFHTTYEESENDKANNWNNHLVPGIEAAYGYNLVNVSHYDISQNRQKNFFEKPVLIKTLYYPAFSKDTLNFKPVSRASFIVSVYNDDTNKDGFINLKDLRRLYLFNSVGEKQQVLVPENYSVFKSEYDPGNDLMFVFAQLDENKNGARDEAEPVHIFWIDLNNPLRTGRQY